jgi:hypothetical protein
MRERGLIPEPITIERRVLVAAPQDVAVETDEDVGEIEPVTLGDDADADGGEIISAGKFDVAFDCEEPDDYIEPKALHYLYNIWPYIDAPFVLLSGPAGVGKTLAARVLAARLGRPLIKVECEPEMTAQELLGMSRIAGGTDYWQPGPFQIAAEMSAAGLAPILFFDEFSVLGPGAMYKFAPLDGNGSVSFTNTAIGRRFCWKEPKCIVAFNEDYAGNREITRAIRDRGRTLEVTYLPEPDEVKLLVLRKSMDLELAEKAVRCANALRAAARGTEGTIPLQFDCTFRALSDFADGVKYGQPITESWTEAVIGRVGNSMRDAPTRKAVAEISTTAGMLT